MTHSLSVCAADRPPAMYRSATLAMVVSITSMNVGMTTATATIHGLIAGRLTAGGDRDALLMRFAPANVGQAFQPDKQSQAFQPDKQGQAGKPDLLHGLGSVGPCGSGKFGCRTA